MLVLVQTQTKMKKHCKVEVSGVRVPVGEIKIDHVCNPLAWRLYQCVRVVISRVFSSCFRFRKNMMGDSCGLVSVGLEIQTALV